jgi:hypothetical protein
MSSLVGLYSICTAIARTLEKEAPDSVTKRAAEVKHALEELS